MDTLLCTCGSLLEIMHATTIICPECKLCILIDANGDCEVVGQITDSNNSSDEMCINEDITDLIDAISRPCGVAEFCTSLS